MSVTTGLGWPDLQLLAGGGSGLGWPSAVSRETHASLEVRAASAPDEAWAADGLTPDASATPRSPETPDTPETPVILEASADSSPGAGSGPADAIAAVGTTLVDDGIELRETRVGVPSQEAPSEGATDGSATDGTAPDEAAAAHDEADQDAVVDAVASGGVAEGHGDGLGSLAQSWSQDLPGKDYQPGQRLRAHRPRGAEAAAHADVQSRYLGTPLHDDRKSRLASAWDEPANREVADAALFGDTAGVARDELAEMAAAVTTDDPVSRETRAESGGVDVVETFRQQGDEDQAEMTDGTSTQTISPARPTEPIPTSPSVPGSTPTGPRSTPTGRAQTEGEALPAPRRTRVMTVANQKGGVGKTTTTVNVAAALATAGLRVLVLDLDPQGNASTALGIPHHAEVPSVYDVLVDGAPMRDVVQSCPDVPNLLCAPATIDLAGAEIELVSLVAREMRLGRALTTYLRDEEDRGERIDYVLVDCPPSLGLLTINAFVAAEEVFIPIQCEYYALEGLSQLLKNIELIKAHLNPSLHVSTILLTMYDGRTRLSAQVAEEVRRHFGEQVIRSTVPRSVRISEAPSHGQTVMTYDPTSSGALSYAAAAVEIARHGAGEGGNR